MYVRFAPKAAKEQMSRVCPLSASSGHSVHRANVTEGRVEDGLPSSGKGLPTHAPAGQRNGSNAVSGILSTTRNVIVAAAMR
jgi:hypothetical protein